MRTWLSRNSNLFESASCITIWKALTDYVQICNRLIIRKATQWNSKAGLRQITMHFCNKCVRATTTEHGLLGIFCCLWFFCMHAPTRRNYVWNDRKLMLLFFVLLRRKKSVEYAIHWVYCYLFTASKNDILSNTSKLPDEFHLSSRPTQSE